MCVEGGWGGAKAAWRVLLCGRAADARPRDMMCAAHALPIRMVNGRGQAIASCVHKHVRVLGMQTWPCGGAWACRAWH